MLPFGIISAHSAVLFPIGIFYTISCKMLPGGIDRRTNAGTPLQSETTEGPHALNRNNESAAPRVGAEQAARFGALVRERRKAMGMTQSELAFATGVGRRFIVELESGKPSSHLGRALLAASAVGLRVVDVLASERPRFDLPDLPDDKSEPLP